MEVVEIRLDLGTRESGERRLIIAVRFAAFSNTAIGSESSGQRVAKVCVVL